MEKTDGKIISFWKWFADHEVDFLPLVPAEDLMQKLNQQVQAVAPGLAVELETADKTKLIMTVTTQGVKELIPIVLKTVSFAPKLKWWRIRAFRQRKNGHLGVNFNGVEVESDKLFFTHQTKQGKLTLCIYGPQIEPGNQDGEKALNMLLDYLIGEFDALMVVGELVMKHFEFGKRENLKLKPLVQLPKLVDNLKQAGLLLN